ncbi:hypothetical protein AFLA70_238g001911 [Aspergillus flavus AF70]|nr:hypothetical protein AFLA70_238g001911 [Aspergillus flavus AF70]
MCSEKQLQSTMAENTKDSAPSAVSTDNLNQPKRVILQHRANDFDNWSGEDYHSVIRLYAALSRRPVDEFDFGRKIHYTHAQTPLAAVRGFFYITLDLHKDLLRNPDPSQVQHEIYRVCRTEDGTISPCKFRNPVKEQNLLRKIRHFSDTLDGGD